MTKVYGLEVPDERMARIAKMILNVHLFIIVVCAVYGIVQCAEHFAVQDAVEDWQAKSDDEGSSSGGADIVGGGVAVIYKIGGPLVVPVLGFFIARAGIQGNNVGILQATCAMDGCCVCCTGCFAMSNIWTFVFMIQQKAMLEEIVCTQNGVEHPDSGIHRWEDYSMESCRTEKDALHDLMSIWAIINILLGILCCCNVAACSLGFTKANEATNALGEQQFFCTPPAMAVPGVAGGPSQPGTVMVVGQPVGMQVPMGQPVGSAVPTNDPNAKVQS